MSSDSANDMVVVSTDGLSSPPLSNVTTSPGEGQSPDTHQGSQNMDPMKNVSMKDLAAAQNSPAKGVEAVKDRLKRAKAPEKQSKPASISHSFVRAHVHHLKKDGKSDALAVAVFNQGPAAEGTLASLRPKIKSHVGFGFVYCLRSQKVVEDSMTIDDYHAAALSEDPPPAPSKENPQIAPPKEAQTKQTGQKKPEPPNLTRKPETDLHVYIRNSLHSTQGGGIQQLLNGEFLVRIIEKNDKERIGGSIQSSELPRPRNFPLANLRQRIRDMSANTNKHEFCLADGTAVGDALAFDAYITKVIDLQAAEKDSEAGAMPTLNVYYRDRSTKPPFVPLSSEMIKRTDMDIKADTKFGQGVSNPITVENMRKRAANLNEAGFSQQELTALASVTAEKYLTPGELDEMQWELVLQNCNAMYGWKFDLVTGSIVRAPRRAFKLRKNLNISQSHPKPTLVLPQVDGSKSGKDSGTHDANKDEATPVAGESKPPSPIGDNQAGKRPSTGNTNQALSQGGDKLASSSKQQTSIGAKDRKDNAPEKPSSIPSFLVVDESRVEVTMTSTMIQESMARNNFTAKSFELGASGTIKGVEIGASGGTAKRDEQGSGSVDTSLSKMLVANYRFPRVMLRFHPGDLEPTDDLWNAISYVRSTKSIADLRELHETFGHLFCDEILLGGCLQTSRHTDAQDHYSESMSKSQFKAQVGIAVSVPQVASFNAKTTQEKGNTEEKSNQETTVKDTIVFEATGGNTILATNPPKWTQSVLDYRNWRIIERGGLTPLVQVIASCHDGDLRNVRQWFVQAVPAFSEIIKIPESRELSVRLKVSSEIPDVSPDRCFYLGHQYGRPVRPIHKGLTYKRKAVNHQKVDDQMFSDIQRKATETRNLPMIFSQTEYLEETALFTPAQARAPVIIGPSSDFAEKDLHTETVWKIVVPHGEFLENNSLVMLKVHDSRGSCWMSVHRNKEGGFMPIMTTSGDVSYWRIRKLSLSGDNSLREGDSIGLCWRFSDQKSGFRDFVNDNFGRRTLRRPSEYQDDLFLKLPFPSFLSTGAPSSGQSQGSVMVLSGNGSHERLYESIRVRHLSDPSKIAAVTYNLWDVQFRLDLVGNEGRGEMDDYMTIGLDQSRVMKTVIHHEDIKLPAAPPQPRGPLDPFSAAGSLLLGPAYNELEATSKEVIDRGLQITKKLPVVRAATAIGKWLKK